MPVGKVAENQPDQQQKQSVSAVNNNNHQNSTVKAAHLDTANGVRTSDLYESGHFEANSDLCGSDAGEHIRNFLYNASFFFENRIKLFSDIMVSLAIFDRFANFNNISANASRCTACHTTNMGTLCIKT